MTELPKLMSIRQVAATGVLPEYALRQMAKQGQLPCIYSGRKCLINYTKLIEQLNALEGVNGLKSGEKP